MPLEIVGHVLSFLPVGTALQTASVSKDFAAAVADSKPETDAKLNRAATMIQKVRRGNLVRNEDPADAFVYLAHLAKYKLFAVAKELYPENSREVAHILLDECGKAAITVFGSGGICFSEDQANGEWTSLDSKELVLDVLELLPSASEQLEAIADSDSGGWPRITIEDMFGEGILAYE